MVGEKEILLSFSFLEIIFFRFQKFQLYFYICMIHIIIIPFTFFFPHTLTKILQAIF